MSFGFNLGPLPPLAYANSPLDRVSGRRSDEAFVRALANSPAARAYVVGGELVVLKKHGETFDARFAFDEVGMLGPVRDTVFLGLDGENGRFGVGIEQESALSLKGRNGIIVLDLRSVIAQGLIPPEAIANVAAAKALLHWHERHGHCANCGAQSTPVHGGWRRDCPACGAEHFPRTDPVVIMLAVNGERCLLGRQARFPEGMWSCLAGFVEPGESIEEAVRRETLEEAGIHCQRVAYFGSQPWPFPMSLMIGCFVEAGSENIEIDRTELEAARWFSREEVAQLLTRQHPGRLWSPPPFAIAHHIMRGWVENPNVLG